MFTISNQQINILGEIVTHYRHASYWTEEPFVQVFLELGLIYSFPFPSLKLISAFVDNGVEQTDLHLPQQKSQRLVASR